MKRWRWGDDEDILWGSEAGFTRESRTSLCSFFDPTTALMCWCLFSPDIQNRNSSELVLSSPHLPIRVLHLHSCTPLCYKLKCSFFSVFGPLVNTNAVSGHCIQTFGNCVQCEDLWTEMRVFLFVSVALSSRWPRSRVSLHEPWRPFITQASNITASTTNAVWTRTGRTCSCSESAGCNLIDQFRAGLRPPLHSSCVFGFIIKWCIHIKLVWTCENEEGKTALKRVGASVDEASTANCCQCGGEFPALIQIHVSCQKFVTLCWSACLWRPSVCPHVWTHQTNPRAGAKLIVASLHVLSVWAKSYTWTHRKTHRCRPISLYVMHGK